MGRPTDNPAERYKKWHWGIPHEAVIDWKDDDYPETLVEIGKLIELHIRRSKTGPIEKWKVAPKQVNACHLAFDPNHRFQRIYILLSDPVRREVRRQFWNPGKVPYDLNQLAVSIGGKHGIKDYPHVQVQPVGLLTHVVYGTSKKGDGPSQYIHEMGEGGSILPGLCVDASGRLWYAGGGYTCPYPGITG